MRITISEPDLHPAYNLENWNCTDRNHFNAFANDQDLVETYLPPFENHIRDAQVSSIICIMNEISGTPACADQFFIDHFARYSTVLLQHHKIDLIPGYAQASLMISTCCQIVKRLK